MPPIWKKGQRQMPNSRQKPSRIPDGIPFRRLASSFATKLLQKMSSLPIYFCVFAFLAFQISSSDAAVGRALVKLGEEYKYQNVPGKWIVKRMTPAHKEPQYLFAGQTAWTTNGKDRIGTAELDAATGTMMIPSFTDNDFGSYTFPLEKPNFSAVNGPEGCVLQGVGETMLDLIKKE
uniref:Uncharacterized protein n=1 Tax=Globodera rostochiensis TaxID=31243 RepID=A0A914I041_GLORO